MIVEKVGEGLHLKIILGGETNITRKKLPYLAVYGLKLLQILKS